MHNRIDIDHTHSGAICREVGERLQAYLKPEPDLPERLSKLVGQLRALEGQSPSTVPDEEHGFGNKPSS
jgi:hypothetical protein